MSKISFALFLLFLATNLSENFAFKWGTLPSTCELVSSNPLPYSTPSPTNVDTKQAKLTIPFSPVVLQNALLAPLKVINTGYALKVEGNPPPDTARTFGGVLCNETYIFREVIFYQTKDPKGRSYTTIDGTGSPLTLVIVYFNKKYGTFENALKYRNGLVIEVFLLDFSPVDNFLFYPVELLIYLLRKAGSFFYVPAGLVYAWFDRLPVLNEYYAFHGSYVDVETGKQYESATIILASRILYVLSQSQFENSFMQLLDTNNKVLENTPPLQPFGKRALFKAYGLNQLLTLF